MQKLRICIFKICVVNCLLSIVGIIVSLIALVTTCIINVEKAKYPLIVLVSSFVLLVIFVGISLLLLKFIDKYDDEHNKEELEKTEKAFKTKKIQDVVARNEDLIIHVVNIPVHAQKLSDGKVCCWLTLDKKIFYENVEEFLKDFKISEDD